MESIVDLHTRVVDRLEPDDAMAKTSAKTSPLDAAMRLLARRAHGRSELTSKLRQRGYSSQEAERAIDRAIELGLMGTDEAVAERYAQELTGKTGATPRWVRQKLLARGLPSAAVKHAVTAAFADWDARASALAVAGHDENLARVARRLERKGFPTDVIGWTVRRLRSDPEET